MSKRLVSLMIVSILVCLLTTIDIELVRCVEPPAIEWTRTYGGVNEDVPLSVIQTSDWGYALAGRTNSFGAGNFDFWLVKTNRTGHEQWNKTFGTVGTERAEGGVIQTIDSGYLLIGHKGVEPNRDMWIVKTDSDGNMMWNKTYGGPRCDTGRGAVLTDDGGYALFGNTRSFGAGDYDFWLVKTNSTGGMEWNQTYGGGGVDLAASLVRTDDGGFALAGRTSSFGAGSQDFWLVKTNSTGGMEWNQTYGTTGYEAATACVQTSDGEYALTGQKGIYDTAEFWLIKTNATGHEQWNETYGGPEEGDDHALSMVQTSDEGYALAGLATSLGAGGRDFWLIKTDPSGNAMWNLTFGESNDDVATSVIQTYDGGYAVAGYIESSPDRDFWLIKLAGPPPVGGKWISIDKYELLVPWIGLTSLITVATISLVLTRRRRKQQN
ncbi:MAG: hypothetical protein OEZ21_09050 [Candidatus Bathyarchaeota archaeon]|nr:hypothetical protein [Candidatus Bathyarchaeota archaeon]MDH5747082.1 hypothetical protein [Candidatus Bathyarchaeota archaeon]